MDHQAPPSTSLVQVVAAHLEAARRELREELGLEVEAIGPPTATFRDPGSPFVIDFVPVIAHGEPEPTEHQAVRWVALAQLADLPLAPADQQFLSCLLQPPP